MRNDALSPDPSAERAAAARGCGARFELALVAAFRGGPTPGPRPPLARR